MVPTPTASPCTGATSGLLALLMVSMKRWTGLSTAPSWRAWLAKSARSLPAVKLSRSPWNRTTRMDGSASTRLSALGNASYMAPVSVFFFSGRPNVSVMTPSAMSVLTCSAITPPSSDRADRLLRLVAIEKTGQALPDNLLGSRHDPIDQLLDRRDVVDQADHHAAAPSARVHVANDHDLGINARDLLLDVLDFQRVGLLALDLEQLVDTLILEYALGIAQRAHYKPRIEFGRLHQRLLHVRMNRCLLSGNEARPHFHTRRTHRQRRNQAARIRHAAGGHERDFQFIGCARQ